MVAPVAFFGRAETGVLAHCPEPPTVHFRVNPASVGILAWKLAWVAHDFEILRAFQKEEIPYQAMRSTKTPPTNCKPADSLPRNTR